MNRVTRQAAFETNSSSTHSIVIANGNFMPDTLGVNSETNEIDIFPGEFGWEIDSHNDAFTKASYCLTEILSCAKVNESVKSFTQKDVRSVVSNSHIQNLLNDFFDVIQNSTSHKVRIHSCDDYYGWGYIDHQSAGTASEAFESQETLRNFIFNPQSCLSTDNDNY